MKTQMFLFSSLILLMSNISYADQCPSAAQFSHIPGQEWQIDASHVAKGYVVESTLNMRRSKLTQMPAGVVLSMGIDPANTKPLKVWCTYSVDQDGGMVNVNLESASKIDPAKIPVPPFVKENVEGVDSYTCHSSAGNASYCAWG